MSKARTTCTALVGIWALAAFSLSFALPVESQAAIVSELTDTHRRGPDDATR